MGDGVGYITPGYRVGRDRPSRHHYAIAVDFAVGDIREQIRGGLDFGEPGRVVGAAVSRLKVHDLLGSADAFLAVGVSGDYEVVQAETEFIITVELGIHVEDVFSIVPWFFWQPETGQKSLLLGISMQPF